MADVFFLFPVFFFSVFVFFFCIFLQFINYEIRRGFKILMFLLPGPLTFLEKILFASTLYQLYSKTYYLRTDTQILRVLSLSLSPFLFPSLFLFLSLILLRSFLLFFCLSFFNFPRFPIISKQFGEEARTSKGSRRCEILEFFLGYCSRFQSYVEIL